MKKLTENEFEEIFNKIKDVRSLDFSKITGFDDFNEEDQTRIIHEWTIYGSEDYLIDLASEIINQNDDEPYTEARIAKKLNITISLARIIKEYVLSIGEGSINVPTHHEKCIKELKRLLLPTLNSKTIEPERIKLLNEELEGICNEGDPERMLVAHFIAKMFRVTKNYFEVKGAITSSLVAYYLGIHNVDCYKYNIDYHMCHGNNFKKAYTIVFYVPQDKQLELYKMVESLFKDNKEILFGNICTDVNKDKEQYVLSTKLFISKTKEVLDKCQILKNYNGEEKLCITKSELDKCGLDQIQIRIVGNPILSFLNSINQLHPFKKINLNLENTEFLNKLLKNNAKIPLNEFSYDYLYSEFKNKGSLSFTDFVECISYHYNSIDDSKTDLLYSEIHKGDIISVCYDLIKICYCLCNFTDESAKIYLSSKFNHSEFKNKIFSNQNKYESYKYYLFLNEYLSKFQNRYIGIFFFINGKLSIYKEQFKIDETLDFIDVDKSHYDLFNSYKLPMEFEYSMFPRGRVLYNVKEHVFYLYADKSILKSNEKIELLKKEFNLPKFNVKIKGDEHYKTLKY